jgi:ABC-2 type transport system permease protein
VASGYFVIAEQVDSLGQITTQLDSGRSWSDWLSRRFMRRTCGRGTTAQVQLLVDGTNSNTATIALGYAAGIVAVGKRQPC